MKSTILATALFCLSLGACQAQEQGFTANLNSVAQTAIPDSSYTLVRFTNVLYNTMPAGSVISTASDFAFVAPRSGIVRFHGQFWDVLDSTKPQPINPAYVVKIFKNAPCSMSALNYVFAGIGGNGGFWWANEIQVQGEDLATLGDVYRWCIYATSGAGNTSYLDGHPAHTRVHVSMPN